MSKPMPRAILARNLKAIIEADKAPSLRAWAIGKGLDVRLIDRLSKGEHAVTLDKLADIASACGLEPWHLLLDDFKPGNQPPAPISAEDKALIARLKNLLGP